MSEENAVNKFAEEVLLSEQKVFDVLEFATWMDNTLTPMLLNQRMRESNLNPLQASETTLANAMKDPINSELDLQSFSQDFEIQSQPYKRLLSYLGSMLSFDLTYECLNAESKDYKTRPYLKDLDVVKSFLDSFDYKYEFSNVVKELLRNEAYFGCPRMEGKKYVLQELPASPTYTMITGRWDYGLLFSLNMYWFTLPGVNMNMYPSFFKKKYANVFENSSQILKYRPSATPEMRGNSAWVYWQDIPVDVGWCWKLNPTLAARVPYFSGLFLDLVQQPLMRSLQKNINMSTASRLLVGQVGVLKDATGKVKDQFNIMPETLGKFLALVKSAISESMKVAAAPLENMQGINFPAENAVYPSYLKTALATSGINTNLIFTSDVKPNAIESQLSLNVDEQLMYNIYPQCSNFLEYNINKLTKTFKFKFNFEGTEFFNNRQMRLDTQLSLMTNGIYLPQKIASAIGMNPFSFQRHMDEAKANGWTENLVFPNMKNALEEKTSDEKGRPRKKDSELTDSGAQTRADASNVGRGGSV